MIGAYGGTAETVKAADTETNYRILTCKFHESYDFRKAILLNHESSEYYTSHPTNIANPLYK